MNSDVYFLEGTKWIHIICWDISGKIATNIYVLKFHNRALLFCLRTFLENRVFEICCSRFFKYIEERTCISYLETSIDGFELR